MALLKKRKKTERVKDSLRFTSLFAWLFTLPGLIVFTFLGWYPLVIGLMTAFQKFYLIKPAKFIGLENFNVLFVDMLFPVIFRNTLYYTALSLALTFFIPILIAIFLMEMKKGVIRIMMILWFIPIASMASILLWKWFYNVEWGLFNGILATLGLPTLKWLNDPRIAMLCLVLPGLIMYGPGLIYIASIQGIPDELYESAELEGASFWQKIWYITLPRLRPIISMMLILSVIGNMQVFDQPQVMTGGGPVNATLTVVMYIYRLAFSNMAFGRGAALALLLFLLIMSLTIIQRKYFKENIDI